MPFIRGNMNGATCHSSPLGGKAPASVRDDVAVVIGGDSARSWVKDLID
jgi:hypothetical protein